MIGAAIFVFGLCAGSFANASAWRIYQQSKKKKNANKYSILHGRSMCENCQHQLAGKDLVPVFSWLSLRGKCRYCAKPVSAMHPIVELLSGAAVLFNVVFWPDVGSTRSVILLGIWLAILIGLIILFIYDLKWMILPTQVIRPLIGLAVIYQVIRLFGHESAGSVLVGSVAGLLIGGGIFWLLYQISKGSWIGGGDVRLGAMFGILLGPTGAVGMIFIASCLGVIVSLPLMLNKKAKLNTKIPYGPFLIIAGVIMQLFGAGLVAWYKRKFIYL